MSREIIDALKDEEDREIEAEVQAQVEAEQSNAPPPPADAQKTVPIPTQPFEAAGPSIDIPVPVPAPEKDWAATKAALREAKSRATSDRAPPLSAGRPRPRGIRPGVWLTIAFLAFALAIAWHFWTRGAS